MVVEAQADLLSSDGQAVDEFGCLQEQGGLGGARAVALLGENDIPLVGRSGNPSYVSSFSIGAESPCVVQVVDATRRPGLRQPISLRCPFDACQVSLRGTYRFRRLVAPIIPVQRTIPEDDATFIRLKIADPNDFQRAQRIFKKRDGKVSVRIDVEDSGGRIEHARTTLDVVK
jgi:hypothetical protein